MTMRAICSPLELAVIDGDLAAAKRLLENGASLACEKTSQTLLMLAAMGGHANLIPLLLEVVDPLARDEAGRTAFDLACSWERWSCVEALAWATPGCYDRLFALDPFFVESLRRSPHGVRVRLGEIREAVMERHALVAVAPDHGARTKRSLSL
jgi:hypothetical protein